MAAVAINKEGPPPIPSADRLVEGETQMSSKPTLASLVLHITSEDAAPRVAEERKIKEHPRAILLATTEGGTVKKEERRVAKKGNLVKEETRTSGFTRPKVTISTQTQTSIISSQEDHDSDVEEDQPSQVTLSQTDETIRQLDKEGELGEVVGSQSMLSQELIYSSQRQEDEEGEDRFAGLQSSQATETSVAMAQRLGLLTQEENSDSTNTYANAPISLPSTQELCTEGFTMPPQSADAKTPPTESFAERRRPLTDTPVRESECFGSLLDAVQKITEQEEFNAKLYAYTLQHRTSNDHMETNPQEASTTTTRKPKSFKRKSSPENSDSGSPSSPKKSRKSVATKRKENKQREEREIAQRAAAVAEQTVADPEMAKKLLLSMALVRENPRSAPNCLAPRGSTVPEGFFWAHYPPLESVLKQHMAEYYELSTTKCQSAQQQAFNNYLVILVRKASIKQGWRFHQSFSDKCLRDRIRCYYKTHIQNAKKRLRTMVRNPTKRANARHLCEHLDLIESHEVAEEAGSDDGEGAKTLNSISRTETSKTKSPTTSRQDKPVTQSPAAKV